MYKPIYMKSACAENHIHRYKKSKLTKIHTNCHIYIFKSVLVTIYTYIFIVPYKIEVNAQNHSYETHYSGISYF